MKRRLVIVALMIGNIDGVGDRNFVLLNRKVEKINFGGRWLSKRNICNEGETEAINNSFHRGGLQKVHINVLKRTLHSQ